MILKIEKPIFIYGCDRSGTTMIGDIIGGLENCFVTPESQFIQKLMKYELYKNYKTSSELYDEIINDFRFQSWEINLNPELFSMYYNDGNYKKVIEYILSEYIIQNIPNYQNIDSFRWVDHTPSNMDYVAVQKEWWEKSLYIHMVRDGRAVYSSIKYLDWGPNNAMFGARFWVEKELYAIKIDKMLSNKVILLKYEDIVEEPEKYIKEVCKFLNVPYVSSCLRGGALKLPNFTKTIHSLVGSTLNVKRVKAWKHTISKKELIVFCSNIDAVNILKLYNYDECIDSSYKIYLLEYIYFHLQQLIKGLLHRYKKIREKRY